MSTSYEDATKPNFNVIWWRYQKSQTLPCSKGWLDQWFTSATKGTRRFINITKPVVRIRTGCSTYYEENQRFTQISKPYCIQLPTKRILTWAYLLLKRGDSYLIHAINTVQCKTSTQLFPLRHEDRGNIQQREWSIAPKQYHILNKW